MRNISKLLKNNDLVEVADALGDMLYILCGTIIEHGNAGQNYRDF